MIRNVHERVVELSPADAWALVDRIAEPDGVLWPTDDWPPVRFDRPLAKGATGGHGMIRYTCVAIEPGERVTFAFDPSMGFNGTHSFLVLPGTRPGTCVLRHELVGRPGVRMGVTWAVVIRWLHDALLEELMDRAVIASGHSPARPARRSPWVRVLRAVLVRVPVPVR